MRPVTIDFEASCLPRDGRSFPIEVGVSDASGNSRSWLIKPRAGWSGWIWTAEAESLHGITQAQLERDGMLPEIVLYELNTLIGNDQIIADSWLDTHWLDTLCDQAGAPASFTIALLADVLDGMAPSRAQFVAADKAVAKLRVTRHRAGEDARHLASWLAALTRSESAPARAAA